VLLLLIVGVLAGTDDEGDEVATDDTTTTGAPETTTTTEPEPEDTTTVEEEPEEAPETTVAAEPVSEDDELACQDDTGDLMVDQEADPSAQYPALDLTEVRLDVADDELRVTWELAGDVPSSLVSADGMDMSHLYGVHLGGEDGSLEFLLHAQVIGEEWFVSVFDARETERSNITTAPLVDRNTLTVRFPRAALTRPTATWWAVTEGDGDPDPDFDFLFLMVQDICPASDSIIVPAEARLPLRLN
jgi:hypothetical protein